DRPGTAAGRFRGGGPRGPRDARGAGAAAGGGGGGAEGGGGGEHGPEGGLMAMCDEEFREHAVSLGPCGPSLNSAIKNPTTISAKAEEKQSVDVMTTACSLPGESTGQR